MKRLQVLFLALILLRPAMAAELPDPKTSGPGGKPLAILYLTWAPFFDKTYGEKLTARGYVYARANYMEPIAPEFLKQFNVFVFDEMPAANYDYREGVENFRSNLRQIRQCVEAGAGLLTYAAYDGAFLNGWGLQMKPYGIRAYHRGIVDDVNGGIAPWKSYVENSYGWTKVLDSNHPVTAGLKRVYYPMGELNATGVFPTVPLVCDSNWRPLVKTMPTSHLVIFNPPSGPLLPEPDPQQSYTICAVRMVGKGRVAALSISPEYTHRSGYSAGQTAFELKIGNQAGTLLEKGDGSTPSDDGEMLMRLYAWLAGDSGKTGFGGYQQGAPVIPGKPETPVANETSGQQFKALIGVHSKYSDGAGTVAEYAQAARQAGYGLLIFTESFEKMKREQWDVFAAECEKNSDDRMVVLPGFEIQDVEGSRFLYFAPPYYPHRSWLTEDGKRLLSPYTLNFYYSKHMVVLHRPESSPMPTERLKHFQGVSVYTYRDGKLLDNSLGAFIWEVQSASFPVPIVVHELFKPEEVAKAARTGFQQYLPEAPTASDAVNRFCRQGCENPTHPMIGEGPMIAPITVTGGADPNLPSGNKAEKTFRLEVNVTSETPLKMVTLYDGYVPVRRWLATGKEFHGSADFPFSHQYGFWVLAEDATAHQALRSRFWISPARSPGFFRCTDRQNWLGHVAMYYTGAFLPFGGAYNALRMPIKGTEEGNGLFTQLPGTCMAPKMNLPFTCNDVSLTEFVLDEKYVDSTFNDVGLAATPSHASRSPSVYSGRVRHYSFTQSLPSEPWVALIEYDLTLKRAVEPRDPTGLFPSINHINGQDLCRWDGKAFVKGKLDPKDQKTPVSVPCGSLGGGIIPLDDDYQIMEGAIGRILPGAPDYLPAGTRLNGSFLLAGRSNQVGTYDKVNRSFETAPETWLSAMGFAGATPYRIEMTRGKLGTVTFFASMTPDHGGVAGEVGKTAAIPYQIPMKITGLNPRWVAGSWREGGHVTFTGVFETIAWPRLDVSQKGKFYAGNLLTADNPNLVLSLSKWNADSIAIEVHNPTAKPIEATVSTPAEITGYKSFRQKVTVPAGTTIFPEG